MSDRRVPVLIVGGSLVGLSTSLLLAAQEVPHLLVERHRGTAVHPRAASFHQGPWRSSAVWGASAATPASATRTTWKLAAVVGGTAGAGLLPGTYHW